MASDLAPADRLAPRPRPPGAPILDVRDLRTYFYQEEGVVLAVVGAPDPERRVGEYAFQLSGGLRQRAMIALALSCGPRILIADEPTTALDVTTQAQILELLRRLQAEEGMAIILITHNLGVVAEM